MLKKLTAALLVVAYLLAALPVLAAALKTYRVTGLVLELTNDLIVVQKDKERWEIARDAATQVTGNLKVGAMVTIQYRMTAAAIEVKPEKAKKAGKNGR